MSVKIRISYTTPQELQTVVDHLKPILRKLKYDKGKEGTYKKAYAEVDIKP